MSWGATLTGGAQQLDDALRSATAHDPVRGWVIRVVEPQLDAGPDPGTDGDERRRVSVPADDAARGGGVECHRAADVSKRQVRAPDAQLASGDVEGAVAQPPHDQNGERDHRAERNP